VTLILRWLGAFERFWYHFLIGDDWTIAATVAAALAATWLLHVSGVSAWWLVPVAAAAVVGMSLRRSARPGRRAPRPRGSADGRS
jgi:hypothetical protein